MTKLSAQSVSGLLAAFRSSEPTPGGGSASALASAVGASLLTMVASLPKPRATSDEEVSRLQAAGAQCTALAMRLEALIDEDSTAYDAVVAAFRLPKTTDAEKNARAAAIQDGLRLATDVPLEVMRRSVEALVCASTVSDLGNANASSDVQVGRALLAAGARGARHNVEINLGSLKDAEYVARVRQEAADLALKARVD